MRVRSYGIFGWILASTIALMSLTSVTYGADDSEPGAEKTVVKKKKKKKKKNKKTSDGLKEESGEPVATGDQALNQRKWQVLLNVGLDPSPFIGFGGTIGRSLSPSTALEFYASHSSGKVEPVAITITSVGGRLRKSFGKIPYVAGGLGFRMASGSWFTYNEAQDDELATTSAVNAITLDLAVGGQIQFGAFVVGADLAGIAFPMTKIGAKDTPPTDAYDQADFDEQKAKFSKTAGGMGLILCKLGIGFSF